MSDSIILDELRRIRAETNSNDDDSVIREELATIRKGRMSGVDVVEAIARPVIQSIANQPRDRSIPAEVGAGMTSGAAGLIGGAAGLARMGAGLVENVTGPTQLTGAVRDAERLIGLGAENVQARNAPSDREGLTPRRVAHAVGQGVPLLGAQVGIGVATGGASLPVQLAAFAGTAAAPVAGMQYRQALDHYAQTGVDQREAENRAALEAAGAALITSATNLVPGAILFNKVPGAQRLASMLVPRVAAKFVASGTAEAAQEASEQLLTDIVAAKVREDPVTYNRDYWEQIGLASVAGFALGGVAGTGIDIANDAASRQVSTPTETPETVETGFGDARAQAAAQVRAAFTTVPPAERAATLQRDFGMTPEQAQTVADLYADVPYTETPADATPVETAVPASTAPTDVPPGPADAGGVGGPQAGGLRPSIDALKTAMRDAGVLKPRGNRDALIAQFQREAPDAAASFLAPTLAPDSSQTTPAPQPLAQGLDPAQQQAQQPVQDGLAGVGQGVDPTPTQRARVSSEIQSAFGPESSTILPVIDAFAAGWAKKQGKTVDDYYKGLNVVKGGTPGSGALFSIQAWHGSPHVFDKFSTSKIGTGEGAQAYGHGLYFTSTEEIADYYRKALSRAALTYQGKSASELDLAARSFLRAFHWETLNPKADKATVVAQMRRRADSELQRAIEERDMASGAIKRTRSGPRSVKAAEEIVAKKQKTKDFADAFVPDDFRADKGGRKYKVELAPQEEELLDWDKPLSQQSESVRSALSDLITQHMPTSATGRDLYESMAGRSGGQDAASAELRSIGIRGIKYKGRTSDIQNYVIFDDADVAIKEVFQRGAQGAPAGSYEINAAGQRIIRALTNPDASTLPHEVAHDFLEMLPQLDPDLAADAALALGAKPGEALTVPQKERFARGFERYLRDGKAPIGKLKEVFARYKQWLTDLYKSIRGTPLERTMNQELKSVFDRMLSAGDQASTPTTIAPTATQSFLTPGDTEAAMGAAMQPGFERDPVTGGARPILRSARDLVFNGGKPTPTDSPPKVSKFQFADPDVEQRFASARSPKGKIGVGEAFTNARDVLIENTTRGSTPRLPRGAKFGADRELIIRSRQFYAIAQDQAAQLIDRTVRPLSGDEYDLFTRSVILNDLVEDAAVQRQRDGATTPRLPFGFTEQSATAEKARIDAAVAQSPNVQAAIEYRRRAWENVRKDLVDAYSALGQDISERFQRQDYFRHQVLDYGRALRSGGKRLQATKGPYAFTRKGSDLDINANYAEVEAAVMATMLADAQRAKAIAAIQNRHDIIDHVKAKAKAAGDAKHWQDFIPDTHVAYVHRPGKGLFAAWSVREHIAQQLFEESVAEIGITSDDLRKVLVNGAQADPIVIPKELAAQLEAETGPARGLANLILGATQSLWKRYTLQAPHRILKYNLRNITGDGEKVASFAPGAFQQVPAAARDVARAMKNPDATPADLRAWIELGGAKTTFRNADTEDIQRLDRLAQMASTAAQKTGVGSLAALPAKAWNGYWRLSGIANDVREAALRYAAFKHYLDQMRTSQDGSPKSFGVSRRDEVMALPTVEERAFKLSTELLGRYDDISAFGQWMRSYIYPFWSFQELNIRSYTQGIRNLMADDQLTFKTGAKIATNLGVRVGVGGAINLGRVAIALYGMSALTAAINNLLFPDEERDLPDDIRRRPHIILGRDKEGRVLYFDRLGSSPDFLEWFGADALYGDISDILSGRRSIRELAGDYAKSPLNKVVQGISPAYKTPLELLSGQTYYPDAFNPRTIRDPMAHLFGVVGHAEDYQRLAGKPVRSLSDRAFSMLAYRIEPDKAAYFNLKDLERRWNKQHGRPEGRSVGGRSTALYDFKLAIRYDDKDAASQALLRYFEFGGTPDGIRQSLDRMAPLSSIPTSERRQFLNSLTPVQRELLEPAKTFHRDTLTAGSSETIKIPTLIREARQAARAQ